MKKIWLYAAGIVAGAALVALFVLGIHYWRYTPKPDGKYDNNNYLVSTKVDFKRVKESVVHIIARAEYRYDKGRKKHIDWRSVGGVVFMNRYVISAGHGVAEDGRIKLTAPSGIVMVEPAKIVSRNFAVLDSKRGYIFLELLYVDYGKDIAIYKLPQNVLLPSFPYDIGNSDEFKEGNFVYIIGNPLGAGINIRDGIIGAREWQGGDPPRSDVRKKDFFTVNVGVIYGDSGTLILMIRDGMYELGGFVSAAYLPFNQLGFIVKINVVREVVQACIVCPGDLKRLFAVPQNKRRRTPHL